MKRFKNVIVTINRLLIFTQKCKDFFVERLNKWQSKICKVSYRIEQTVKLNTDRKFVCLLHQQRTEFRIPCHDSHIQVVSMY